MSKPRRQIILGAYLGGVNHHTLWSGPAAGGQIDFSSFRHLAQTAERGKFDFFFLGEGVIPRERLGLIFDQDVLHRDHPAGQPRHPGRRSRGQRHGGRMTASPARGSRTEPRGVPRKPLLTARPWSSVR